MKVPSRERPVVLRPFITAVSRWLCFLGCCVSANCFSQAPVNDDFTNAIPLYGNSLTFTGTVANATYEDGESPCLTNFTCFPGGSVWWTWTATNSSAVIIDTIICTPVGTRAGITIHTGTDVTTLVDLDWNAVEFPTNRYVSFLATMGMTYRIRAIGDATDLFTLRLTATNRPMILRPPQSQTVAAGGSVVFSEVAAGLKPLAYQWQFKGSDLAGQTKPILLLHGVTANEAGSYSVIVSNLTGVSTSAAANLTISPSDPRPWLALMNVSNSSYVQCALTGSVSRTYWIEATTNLFNWSNKEIVRSINYTNGVSEFWIYKDTNQKYFRATPVLTAEVCIAHLREIDAAVQHWAIQVKKAPTAYVTETDITPYLPVNPVCPAGGTFFSDSYRLSVLVEKPICMKVPSLHYLLP